MTTDEMKSAITVLLAATIPIALAVLMGQSEQAGLFGSIIAVGLVNRKDKP